MLIKIPLFLPVNDENSFNQNFFLVRRQSGRVKRHAYSYVFLLRPPLPKARSRGGRQFLLAINPDDCDKTSTFASDKSR